MDYKSVRVRMPSGQIRKAKLNSTKTKDGYRNVLVGFSGNIRVAGRVLAKHGFNDDRIHVMEVKASDIPKLPNKVSLYYKLA